MFLSFQAVRHSQTGKSKKGKSTSTSAAEVLKANTVEDALSSLVQGSKDSRSIEQALPDLELLSSSSEISSSQESNESESR